MNKAPDHPVQSIGITRQEKKLYLPDSAEELLRIYEKCGRKYIYICSSETAEKITENRIILGSRDDPYMIASKLYDSLRKLDNCSENEGIIEPFPGNGIYLSIMNRIKKASVKIMDGEL
ncbi:SUA5 domain protein [mine drainage metagenome]|uniref:SUA5 domain protein n=1 Tax=mine drainage metagenome TaxID=410659 RepID=T1BFH1_9ZZZZ